MDIPTHRRDVGLRLLMAIQTTGMTQSAVGRLFDVSPHKLGNWTRGDHYPDPIFLCRFADQFGVSLDWIYRGKLERAATRKGRGQGVVRPASGWASVGEANQQLETHD